MQLYWRLLDNDNYQAKQRFHKAINKLHKCSCLIVTNQVLIKLRKTTRITWLHIWQLRGSIENNRSRTSGARNHNDSCHRTSTQIKWLDPKLLHTLRVYMSPYLISHAPYKHKKPTQESKFVNGQDYERLEFAYKYHVNWSLLHEEKSKVMLEKLSWPSFNSSISLTIIDFHH